MMTLREYLQLKNGTDVRGIATEGIAGEEVNLTPEAAEAIAEAFAEWLCRRTRKSPLRIAVGSRFENFRPRAVRKRPERDRADGQRCDFHASFLYAVHVHALKRRTLVRRRLGDDYGQPPPLQPQRPEIFHGERRVGIGGRQRNSHSRLRGRRFPKRRAEAG